MRKQNIRIVLGIFRKPRNSAGTPGNMLKRAKKKSREIKLMRTFQDHPPALFMEDRIAVAVIFLGSPIWHIPAKNHERVQNLLPLQKPFQLQDKRMEP